MSLTIMKVGVKGQSAVLYVEGEGVDVEVAGADDSDWFCVVHQAGIIQVHIGDLWSCVFIHTGGRTGRKGVCKLCVHFHPPLTCYCFQTCLLKGKEEYRARTLTTHWSQCLAPKICFWEGKSCWCRTAPGPSRQTHYATSKVVTWSTKNRKNPTEFRGGIIVTVKSNDLNTLHNSSKGMWSTAEPFHPGREDER